MCTFASRSCRTVRTLRLLPAGAKRTCESRIQRKKHAVHAPRGSKGFYISTAKRTCDSPRAHPAVSCACASLYQTAQEALCLRGAARMLGAGRGHLVCICQVEENFRS